VLYGELDAAQVRFDRTQDVARISYSVDANFRGKGLATALLGNAIERFTIENPEIQTLIAQVKATNKASTRVFEKLNFQVKSAIDGQPHNSCNLTLKIIAPSTP